MWVPEDYGPHLKLIPLRRSYPSATIVTVDDDVLYRNDLVHSLTQAAAKHPGTIVGNRGWTIAWSTHGPAPYFSWPESGKAGPRTSSDDLFLTGVGGVLYPPGEPRGDAILDADAAVRVAPTADDVWFWAASVAAGTPRFCTGAPYGQSNGLDGLSPALLDTNRTENDAQIARALRHFELEEWARARGIPA